MSAGSQPRPRFARAATIAALAAAGLVPAAHAGTVRLFSYNGGGDLASDGQQGFATVTSSSSGAFGQANAYEFVAGIGVSAFASSRFVNMQAVGSAGFADRFVVDCGGTVQQCRLTVFIDANGSTSARGSASSGNPALHGSATSGFTYSWVLGTAGGSVSGAGGQDERFFIDGTSSFEQTGNGAHGSLVTVDFMDGESYSLSLHASVFATSDNTGDGRASAATDFSHTLRWGGVKAAVDMNGNPLAGFSLASVNHDGFDYRQAAGPNPFVSTGTVPEPATWALAGLAVWVLGAARRRA